MRAILVTKLKPGDVVQPGLEEITVESAHAIDDEYMEIRFVGQEKPVREYRDIMYKLIRRRGEVI